MKLTRIAILLSGAALSATVLGASAANIGDETDTSWQYAPKAQPFFSGSTAQAAKQAARVGDETDTSWQYAPKAKPFFSSSDSARPAARIGDENDASQYATRGAKPAL